MFLSNLQKLESTTKYRKPRRKTRSKKSTRRSSGGHRTRSKTKLKECTKKKSTRRSSGGHRTRSKTKLKECTKKKSIVGSTGNKRYLITRDLRDLSKSTRELVKLITLSKSNVSPVGSAKWKVHRYPGDIDLFELVEGCCTPDKVARKFASNFKSMAEELQKIEEKGKLFLGDFKAGVDYRYDMASLGHVTVDLKVEDFDAVKTKQNFRDLYNKQLLTKNEFDQVNEILQGNISSNKWEKINGILRPYFVLRWTLSELIKGFKTLHHSGGSIQLYEALQHPSIVKIDVWSPINGNWNETTNFFLLVAKGDKGNKDVVLNQDLGDYVESIQKDINKYQSETYRNSLKLAKRVWNKAAFQKDDKKMKQLAPLFGSDAAKLNQVVGELEVIRLMVDKLPENKLPKEDLSDQIDRFIRRIGDTLEVEITRVGEIYKMLESASQLINHKDIQKKKIMNLLQQVEGKLKKVIEEFSSKYLKEIGMSTQSIIEDLQKGLFRQISDLYYTL
jgi:hypothetical protein